MSRLRSPVMLAGILLLVPGLARAQEAANPPVEAAEAADSEPQTPEERLEALEAELEAMQARLEEAELERLLEQAAMEAMMEEREERPEERTFVARGRALQATNPEMSVSGDFVGEAVLGEGLDEVDLPIRSVGVHFQSDLDPYSMTRIAVEFFPDPEEPVNLEEAYLTWSGAIPGVSLTLGRFRNRFGVVNRWHEHDLDQVNYPMPLLALTGSTGVLGTGVGVQWLMPRLWAHAQELTFEVGDTDAEVANPGGALLAPSALARLKSFWDLSDATYLELGFSGMGALGEPAMVSTALGGGDALRTVLAGADLTLAWSPPQQARYRSFTWRTEGVLRVQEDPDGAVRRGWGAWSYVEEQLGARWYVGLRGDVLQEDLENADLAWRLGPYATFWQSEFVFLRLEYGLTQGRSPDPEHRILLQASWAAGPHKHERY